MRALGCGGGHGSIWCRSSCFRGSCVLLLLRLRMAILGLSLGSSRLVPLSTKPLLLQQQLKSGMIQHRSMGLEAEQVACETVKVACRRSYSNSD